MAVGSSVGIRVGSSVSKAAGSLYIMDVISFIESIGLDEYL